MSRGRTRRIRGWSPARVCGASAAPRPGPRARARADQGRAPPRKKFCGESSRGEESPRHPRWERLSVKGPLLQEMALRPRPPAATRAAQDPWASRRRAGSREETPAPAALWGAQAARPAGFRGLLCPSPLLRGRTFRFSARCCPDPLFSTFHLANNFTLFLEVRTGALELRGSLQLRLGPRTWGIQAPIPPVFFSGHSSVLWKGEGSSLRPCTRPSWSSQQKVGKGQLGTFPLP